METVGRIMDKKFTLVCSLFDVIIQIVVLILLFWWLTEFLAKGEALPFNRASRLAPKPLHPCGFSAYQQYGLESAIQSFL
jgi:hypothetical protein